MSDAPTAVSHENDKELDSDDVSKAMSALRAAYPRLHGLQDPGYGQSVQGHSLPRFDAVSSPFVQVLLLYCR